MDVGNLVRRWTVLDGATPVGAIVRRVYSLDSAAPGLRGRLASGSYVETVETGLYAFKLDVCGLDGLSVLCAHDGVSELGKTCSSCKGQKGKGGLEVLHNVK